ncbi:MAG: MarR family winged helix-turn-helix transcriptional regulator [Bacteroidota bacterium]
MSQPDLLTATTLLPGVVLERTAKRMKQYFQKQLQLAQADITIDQWVVLQELQHKDGHSQLDLAKATFKDAPTITRIIDLLCKKGLTERITDPTDRRRFQIKLTELGRAKIEEVQPIIKEARGVAWEGIPKAEIDQMMHTLNQLFENLTK